MNVTPLTPLEQTYVATMVTQARTAAAEALATLRAPAAAVGPAGDQTAAALRRCYDAAEHLHDIDQVDVPAELAENIRHALEELQGTIAALQPGGAGVTMVQPTPNLGTAVEKLIALEHTLRGVQPTVCGSFPVQ